MSKRLFVGGLPYGISNTQLEEMFTQFGAVVSCNVITDKFTGRSKGFGFVEMENDEEADKAIQSLNETELEGRKIAVNVARPREERPSRDFGSGGSSFGGRGPRRDRRDSGRGGRY
ncbi:MAG TPA: RNA-binding protein [Patescibacteria group bacterium]|nr:RNA-binding protein [Candidatus Hodarchaeales archaeon]HLD11860.1 RNA-binding protein [Patescibacteria group bacterium]